MTSQINQNPSTKSLDIEISSLCNIKCNFCPRSSITRPKGIMDRNMFKILFNWLPENLGITFSGMGEPLTNPDVCFFIKELRKKNIKVFLKTNGIELTPTLYNNLIDSGVWHIQISIISSLKRIAEHKISSAVFQKLQDNLTYISGVSNPPVSFSLVKSNNIADNEDRIKFAEIFKLPLFITKLHSRGGELYHIKENNSNTDMEDFCQIFQYTSFITWQGDILSCCHDITGQTSLSNISNTSFLEIDKIKTQRIKESGWFSICKHCDDALRYTFKKSLDAIKTKSII